MRSEIERWATRGYPHEVCGLLVGRMREGAIEITRVLPARNLALRARDRFELAPEDWIDADRAARASGLEVVGVWHSHPDVPAVPSRADEAGAWEGYSHVIAAVDRGGVRELRAYLYAARAFLEQGLLVEADVPRAAGVP